MSNFIGQRIGDVYGVFTYGWPPQEKGFTRRPSNFSGKPSRNEQFLSPTGAELLTLYRNGADPTRTFARHGRGGHRSATSIPPRANQVGNG